MLGQDVGGFLGRLAVLTYSIRDAVVILIYATIHKTHRVR